MEVENEQDPEKEWDCSKRRKYYNEQLKDKCITVYATYEFDRKLREVQNVANAYTQSVSDAAAFMDKSYRSNYLDEFFLLLAKEIKHRGLVSAQSMQRIFLDILQHADERDALHKRRYKGMVERWIHLSSIHGLTMEKNCAGPACNHIAPIGKDDLEDWDWDHRDRHSEPVQIFYRSIFDDARLCGRCYRQYPRWDTAPVPPAAEMENTAIPPQPHRKEPSSSCDSDEDEEEEGSEVRDYPFDDYSLLPVTFTAQQYDPKWSVCDIYPDIVRDVTELFTKEQRVQEAESEIPSLVSEIESIDMASFTRIPFVKKVGFVGCGYGYHNIRKNIVKDIQRDFRDRGRLKKGGVYQYDIVPKVTHDRSFHVNIYETKKDE